VYAIAVSLALESGEPEDQLTGGTLVAVFRSLSAPSDGLEHLRARAGTDAIDIVLFLRATGVPEATAAALRLTEHVLDVEPALRGWTVKHCAQVEIPG
jgi:hypothetical protein